MADATVGTTFSLVRYNNPVFGAQEQSCYTAELYYCRL